MHTDQLPAVVGVLVVGMLQADVLKHVSLEYFWPVCVATFIVAILAGYTQVF